MRKLLTVVSTFLALTMLLSMAACGGGASSAPASSAAPAASSAAPAACSTAPAEEKLPLMALLVFEFANTHNSYIRTGVQNYAKAGKDGKGPVAEIIMTDGQNDQSKQNDQLATILARGDVDIILQGPVDPGAAQTCLDMVKAKDLPMFFFNRAPEFDVLKTYDKVWYTGIPWRLPGEVQAQEVIMDWEAEKATMDRNGDGVLQYVIVKGNNEQPDAIHRTQANLDTFEEAEKQGIIKTELLAMDLGMFNTTKSKELMETWIVKYGTKIEAVVANSDAMVIGAIEALRADGYFQPGKEMYCYSINCLPDAVPLIQSGELRSTILTDPWAQARALVDMSLNVLAGQIDDPTVGTEWKMGADKDIRMNDETPIRLANLQVGIDAFADCLKEVK